MRLFISTLLLPFLVRMKNLLLF